MLETRDILGVEILSVGRWHGTGCPVTGCEFTQADLDEIAGASAATTALMQAPIKLGHDDDQKLLQNDGYPSAGWLANVRRIGEKLIADFKSVPKAIADLIDVGAYRYRSVELESDYEVGGKKWPIFLTGVALLGADLPAVENLADITKLYQSRQLSIPQNGRAVVFSAEPQKQHKVELGGIPAQGTDTSDGPWSASENTRRCRMDEPASYYRRMFAWMDPEGDTTTKGAYKFPHHEVSDDGAVGAANMRACSAVIAVLNGGRGGSDIPDADRKAVWNHVARHLRDGDREPAELQMARDLTYVDHAEHVLADMQAFIERAESLVAMRAADGRKLSEAHRLRLTALRDGAAEVQQRIDAMFGAEPAATGKLLAARARAAQIRMNELQGVPA